MKTPITCSLVLAALCAPALAGPPPSPTSVYRFDVSITGLDSTPVKYTLVVAENQKGEVRSGSNIPYPQSPTSIAREQLGMELELAYTEHAGVLITQGEFELKSLDSAAGANPTWRTLDARGTVPVTVGKPALFASVYDLGAHRTYEVTVTAQKLL